MKLLRMIFLMVTVLQATAQQMVTVNLTEPARDDRFERLNLNLALFELKNDTILSWDYEGMREAQKLKIVKQRGFSAYAYGYIFFAGNRAGHSPGFITVLVGNPYHKYPTLFPDMNNNLDFTDDDVSGLLPWRGDTGSFRFCMPEDTGVCFHIRLTRHVVNGKFAYKDLMNEFYAMTYPDRKFIGMEHCYREQHYLTKAGIINLGEDSFRIALYDGNQNGIYNEADSDRMVIANMNDTLFFPFDDLYSSTISKKQGNCFVDKNGKQLEFISASRDGSTITVKILDETQNAAQIKPGKKLPRFKYTTWKAERKKITSLRRYHTYIYFGTPQSPGFAKDTAALRMLADKYSKQLRVIGFIEVNKSYELSIFGQYSYLNWILAYKDKYLNQKLGIRGLPSTIYTRKRRRVIAYNITPGELLNKLETEGGIK